MTAVAGRTFGIIGALAAFPRRLAAREVERQGGRLLHGVTRRTSTVVLGRGLLAREGDAAIEARVDAERALGRGLLSEKGFLRLLGLADGAEGAALTRTSLLDQSGLAPRHLDLLALFDAFERDAEPHSFRDLILARKYAGLIAGGAGWGMVARSVHRSGDPATLTAQSLQVEGGEAIYARRAGVRCELDGQMLLDLGAPDEELEEIFADAVAAEAAGRYGEAASGFARCLTLDPRDAVAAFNRGNCLRAAGRREEAAHDFVRAIKLDPGFVEAWFNLGGLLAEGGRTAAARWHLQKAVALDGGYGDAVFNLASLEYAAGNLADARRWWSRYLEIDGDSEWARTAARGVQYVDMHGRGGAG
jgi:tetratricopeptide (TPR) repeat protein